MYPISFIGKKQIKTEHFCVNHKLNLTRQEAWESMLRLLVFPCTLLNMVESLHAGEQPTFPLFLGMALTDLVDLGGWGTVLYTGDQKGTGSRVGLKYHLQAAPTSVGPEGLYVSLHVCKPSKEQGCRGHWFRHLITFVIKPLFLCLN